MTEVNGHGHGDYLKYSTKELLAEIAQKIDALGRQVHEDGAKMDRRVAVLEARVPRAEEFVTRFLQVEKDFVGFEKRVSLHEALPAHPQATVALAALRADVEHLKTRETTEEALKSYQGQMADQRRWLIGLSISSVLSLLALVFTILKLVAGGAT